MRRSFIVASILLACANATAAQVYRCAGAGGVSFQEMPCDAGAVETALQVPAFPPVNTIERERLLQREAALDARLVKRAEIDAAERIAREARWAREAERAAERERAKAAEGSYFYPVYPVYAPAVRHRPMVRPSLQPKPLRY